MAEILRGSQKSAKHVFEIALETGRLVILQSPVPVKGPLAEYCLCVSPPEPTTVGVRVEAHEDACSDHRLQRAWLSLGSRQGEYGVLRVQLAHLVIGDLATVYAGGNGSCWHRPDEQSRAVRACNKHRRTGGTFVTDDGSLGIALRFGRGPLWAKATVQNNSIEVALT